MSKQRSDVFTEGMVGSISTFNPMFVTGSDIDRALFELVYTRLIEIDDQGEPLPALAYEWDLTEDGRVYGSCFVKICIGMMVRK